MADPASFDWSTIFTVVGTGIGTAAAAFAIRMGWKNGGSEVDSPGQTMELKSAIVDSSSIKVLAASIEGLGFNLLELKKMANDNDSKRAEQLEKNVKLVERLILSIEGQAEEIRELSREIRDHAREVSKWGK